MKTSIGLLAVAVLLGACAAPENAYKGDPAHFALFVATSNVYMDVPLTVQNTQTGQQYDIPTRHLGGQTGYLMASLPPGRYELVSSVLAGDTVSPLKTPNGWFEVQANCFNYGGAYDFELTEAGVPTYSNTTTLQDISSLPSHYRDLARGQDICAAEMGKASDRLSAADVKDQLAL